MQRNDDQLTAEAERLGAERGANAAAWWEQSAIGGRATGDVSGTARRYLRMIEDGDPELYDHIPQCDLSGEWADVPTDGTITAEVLANVNITLPDDGSEDDDVREMVSEAYRMAYNTAAEDGVHAACRRAIHNLEST